MTVDRRVKGVVVVMLKKLIRGLILREKASTEKFVAYLRKKGVQVGENVRFFSPSRTLVDVTCPWLLSIGDNAVIAHGVIILTHDGAWLTLKRSPKSKGAICGGQAPVKIGNNVFIGMNAIISKGVTVGDNVIIGVGSVVTKDCEPDSVYAGVPAKRIMSVEEYYKKRCDAQFSEAKQIVLRYYEVFQKTPPKEVLMEYFMLFCNLDEALKTPIFKKKMEECCNFEDSVEFMKHNSPLFENYEAFLKACFE